jgi:DNA excision repair protein ERCC-8
LLSGASDASVAVYDVQRATDYEGGGLIAKHKCILVVDKQHEQGHKYAISSAIWYPVDTGLFITGSYDHHINVWDTNTTQVGILFDLSSHVLWSCTHTWFMNSVLRYIISLCYFIGGGEF